MKKMIDLVAGPGSNKDEKLLNYVRREYLVNEYVSNLCFVSGQEDNLGNHSQISAEDFRKLVFEKNDRNTIYFLRNFFFGIDKDAYLKLIEDMCENDIQVFKTDQKMEHVSDDEVWTSKYCQFLSLEDVK